MKVDVWMMPRLTRGYYSRELPYGVFSTAQV